MQCTNCGKQLAADENFCTNCGAPAPLAQAGAVNTASTDPLVAPVAPMMAQAPADPAMAAPAPADPMAQTAVDSAMLAQAQPVLAPVTPEPQPVAPMAPAAPVEQLAAQPVPQAAPAAQAAPAKPKSSSKLLIICLAALAVVGLIVGIVGIVMAMNSGSGGSGSSNNSGNSSNQTPAGGNTVSANTGTKVKLGGHTLTIPDYFDYEFDSDTLYYSTDTDAWVAATVYTDDVTFTMLDSNFEALAASFQSDADVASAVSSRITAGGIDFLCIDVTYTDGVVYTYAYSPAGLYIFGTIIATESGTDMHDYLEDVAVILSTASPAKTLRDDNNTSPTITIDNPQSALAPLGTLGQ